MLGSHLGVGKIGMGSLRTDGGSNVHVLAPMAGVMCMCLLRPNGKSQCACAGSHLVSKHVLAPT